VLNCVLQVMALIMDTMPMIAFCVMI